MLNHILEQVQTVAIGGHIRPDGDCVGSCMGLYRYICEKFPEIQVDIYLEEIPDSFSMFESVKEIKHEIPEGKVYDLFIASDCGDERRLGFSQGLYENAKQTFCVDHHISNASFADHNYIIPEASSASELVYQLLDKDYITTEIAEYLYLGIVHDTGVFQYSSTAPETMEAAANLMRKGIRANQIIEKTFYEKTYAQNLILARALQDSSLHFDGACIVSYLTKETMDLYGVRPKDLEGIVSQLRYTKGAKVAVFMYQLTESEYKISLRASGDVNVNKVAQTFGGGGHVMAAGLTMVGTAEEIVEKLKAEIQTQL